MIGEGKGAGGFLGGEGVFGAGDASGWGVGVGSDDPVAVGRGGGERADVLKGGLDGRGRAEAGFGTSWSLGGAGKAFDGDRQVGLSTGLR